MMKFNEKYLESNFLKFLEGFLPADFRTKHEEIIINKSRYKEITKAKILGFSESLELYVLQMDHTHENDPRIAIATNAFKILADHWIHQAIVVFYNSESENYRLSYLTISLDINEKNKVTKKYSNAKRYSFYLGPSASINTPNQFLINRGRVSSRDDLLSRFSVDIVTKEFFNTYRDTFFDIVDEFNKNETFINEVVHKHEVRTSDFVKKLMGQIVFLYFLQRKGWLGVEQQSKWGTGNPHFVRELFEQCTRQNKNYFNDYLEPLFYDCLGKADRGNSSVVNDQSFAPQFNVRIPYLNGGLFENIYDWKNTKIEIDNRVFQKLLSFFDQYNFTVDENTPSDQEVSVDPEMLGKIFENLLEVKDRKSKGTYYTPREIVHYMCRESLVGYLLTESKIPEQRIRRLFDAKDAELLVPIAEEAMEKSQKFAELKEVADKIDSLLKTIKIVDPAVGSGAFPMGMLSEIASTRYYLNNNFLHSVGVHGKPISLYDIKRETLENCIYGVDLDPGAVEIAKLRFWLALVVDHNIDEIEPLPNLDYKIMQGSSLLEEYLGLRFFQEEKGLFGEPRSEDLRMVNLSRKKKEYFKESSPNRKKELKDEINSLFEGFVNSVIFKEQKEIGAEKFLTRYGYDADKLIEKYAHPEKEKPFFLWKLYFSEVFDEKGGFDVVIANPPYVTTKYGKIDSLLKDAYLRNFETAYDKIDLYVLFFEQAVKIAHTHGVITYITPWNFLANFYSFKIRKYLLDNVKIKTFTKLPPNIFEGIIVDNIISVLQKDSDNDANIILFDDLFDKSKQSHIEQGKYKNNDKYVFDLPKNDMANVILHKMKKDSVTLGSIALNYIGIMTGGQKEMIADSPIFENSKPVLSGRDISRWHLIDRGNFVNFDKKKIHSNDNESVYLSDKKILLRKTGRELIACLDTKQYFSIQSLYNVVVKNKKYKEEYLLALLNSKLFSYIYNQFFITNPEVFPYIKRRNLDQFPIKQASEQEQDKFEAIVNQLHVFVKNINDTDSVANCELKLNTMVYELYGLTPDEIRMIESVPKE